MNEIFGCRSIRIAIMAVICSGTACTQKEDRYLVLAEESIANSQFNDAASYLDEAIRQSPGLAAAYALRGTANLGRHRYADAVRDLEQARSLAGSSFEGYELLAQAYLEVGDADRVQVIASAAAESGKESPAIYVLAGRAYLSELQPEKALREFTACLAIEPQAPDALLYSGVACLRLQRFDEAETFIDRVIDARPGGGYSYWVRAQVREKLGKTSLAENDRGIARELSPGIDFSQADGTSLIETAAGRDRDGQALQRLSPQGP